MKNLRVLLVVVGLTVVLLLAGIGKNGVALLPAAHAQLEKSGCSLASLTGRYALTDGRGTVVVQLSGFPPPPVPFDEIALDTFDGAGHFVGTANVNVGGVLLPNTGVTGDYAVNSDCTGTLTVHVTSLGIDLHHAIIVLDNGRRVTETELDPFVVAHRDLEKLRD